MPKFKLLSLLLLAGASQIHAAPPAPTTLEDAFRQGRFSFAVRGRYESADQSGLREADAYTVRSALGFTTAAWAGWQAMAELENVTSLGDRNDYNAAGTNPGGAGRTVIADPAGTDLNQLWLSYSTPAATFKAGRQRLVLDNARFVGDSGWRQNMQTFDTAGLTLKPAPDFTATYDYVWRVSRVFGNKAPQRDFKGRVHLLNAAYGGWRYGKFTAYAYLLDFNNSPANSSDTFGASLVGSIPVNARVKFTYRAEYARQQDAGKNPVGYRAGYTAVEIGATTKALVLNAGCEVLGSDAGRKGFGTPLATLHAFNGWADVFLATPARGLRDAYLSATLTLPRDFPLRVVYHDYASDTGGLDYGREWDVQLSHKLNPHWTALAKVARYEGAGPFADLTRVWLQAEFTL